MNAKEIKARLLEIDKEKKELEIQLKNIVPEHYPIGHTYYHALHGKIRYGMFHDANSTGHEMIEQYETFQTEEMARSADSKSLFTRKLMYFKELFDLEFKPDWENEKEHKYSVYYDHSRKKYGVEACLYFESKSDIYFSTRDVAQKCADWLGETGY